MAGRRRQPVATGPFETLIQDLTLEGSGVARRNGKTVFIPDTLPGERVSYRLARSRRDYDDGRLLEILEPSSRRTSPRCPHFGVCGGCSLQHFDPVGQIEFKQRQLIDNFQRIGKVSPAEILPPITGPEWGYRRRARLAVRYDAERKAATVGFRERDGRSIVSIGNCDVLDSRIGARFGMLAELIGGLSIRDRIPELEFAVGENGIGMLVRALKAPDAADLELLTEFSHAQGIGVYLQTGDADSIRPLLPDTPALAYHLPRHRVEIRFLPSDFIQTNSVVNEAMVDQALRLLEPGQQDTVLELFSGLGNFTLPLARNAARVVAVDGDKALVQRAQDNAALNGIANVEHHAADLSNPQPGYSWLRGGCDRLLLDPPRGGAREMIPAIAAAKPQRLVYVSCHPGTLARDVGLLVHRHGYRLLAAGIMDMFPHTSHVESMALLAAG